MEPLGSFDATGIIGGLIPVTSASLSAAGLMTIVITTVIEAIADLVVPDFHPGFMVLRLACSSPTNELGESVHLSSQEIAFRYAPGPSAGSDRVPPRGQTECQVNLKLGLTPCPPS